MNCNSKKTINKHIPNIITIIRIFLILVIIPLILINKIDKSIVYSIINKNIALEININISMLIAGTLFIIACFSDFLDGYLARKFNIISDFGKIWDPIADKILINSIFVCLGFLEIIPIWIAVILIIRDIIVDAYRMMALRNNVVVAASWYGKAKTTFLMIGCIICMFFFNKLSNNNLWYFYLIQNSFNLIGTILAIISGILYIYNYYKYNNEYKKKRVDNDF